MTERLIEQLDEIEKLALHPIGSSPYRPPFHAVEQALRRSHCYHNDRDDPDHQCVRSCLIMPQCMVLTCKACDDDDRVIAPADTLPETKLVREVLVALGIEYDALSPEYKARAANAAKRWMARQQDRAPESRTRRVSPLVAT